MTLFRSLICLFSITAVTSAEEPFYLAGEMIQMDHVNRAGVLRPDRDDAYTKYWWDLPHHFVMKPEGAIYSCGAPAALADIPLGTHLHGWFELGPEGEFDVALEMTNYNATVKNKPNEFSPDSQYNRVVHLEDDFTFYHRLGERWKITAIDSEAKTVAAERISVEKTGAQPLKRAPVLKNEAVFDFSLATQVWEGRELGGVERLEVGDEVLFNLTWATLYGPGKWTTVWKDEAAVEFAIERQKRRHLAYLSRRGVPARLDTVEDRGAGKGLLTATFYPGVDPSVLDLFDEKSSGMIIAVNETLRSYDQVNDFKIGSHRKITRSGGTVEIQTEVDELIEGFRPGKSIRIFAHEWERRDIPREERLWPRDVRPLFEPQIPRPEE